MILFQKPNANHFQIFYFRNLSQGSSDTGFFGTMEKKEKNKRLHEGRPDAEKVINELMEGVDLKQSVQEEAESKF